MSEYEYNTTFNGHQTTVIYEAEYGPYYRDGDFEMYVIKVKQGGIDIMPWLTNEEIERIEYDVLTSMQFYENAAEDLVARAELQHDLAMGR